MTGPEWARLLRLRNRILFRWRRTRLERELADELEFHRSLAEAHNRDAGIPAAAARALSHRQMGNVVLAREESRDSWSFMTLESVLQDVRYAVRTLRRAPVFAAGAVFSLALGIGGNTAMFSLVDGLLVRRLPYREPERLVRITGIFPRAAVPAFQQESRALHVAAAGTPSEETLAGAGEPTRVFVSSMSANAFEVLGVSPILGRAFAGGEDTPGRDAVVVLGDSLWKSRFAGDPAVIGRPITLGGRSREIVGVMPPGFSFPSATAQAWIPMRLDPTRFLEYWGGPFVPLFARLGPGVGLEQAAAEAHTLMEAFRPRFPYPMARTFNADTTAISLQQDMMGDVRGTLKLLLASVAVVLLIACANVANLLLSRAATRRKELALRASVGAGRARIVRQLLTEALVLAGLGGGAGLLLGTAALRVFKAVLPPSTPRLAEVAIDWRVAGGVVALTLLAGLVFGLAPALSASQVDLAASMKSGGQRSAGVFWTRLRGGLVAAEVAFTVVLVVGAGLLIRSLHSLAQTRPGFTSEGLLTARISPDQSRCEQPSACVAFYDQLLERARRRPDVLGAALANSVPMDGTLPVVAVDVEGHPKTAEHPAPLFWFGAVTPDYTRIMGIPLLAGRELADSDSAGAERVVLVSAATASRFWPRESAIGKHVKTAGESTWRRIVGVVGDVRQFRLSQGLPDSVPGALYMPYAQANREDGRIPAAMTVLVRTTGGSDQIARELQAAVEAQGAGIPVGAVRSLDETVGGSISSFRSTIQVFVSFALVALLLAAVGIYGLLSHWVAQRTYEIGVRSAIGATRGHIVWMVVGQGLRLAVYGMAAGGLAALGLTRLLEGFLHGVPPNDPLTFASVMAFVLGVAATAAALPALRAVRIDPVRALRID